MPSQPDEIPTIDDIHELVDVVELSDVFFWEERARRVRFDEPAPDEEPKQRTTNSLGITVFDDGTNNGIFYRFRMVFNDGRGAEFVADMEARYALPAKFEIAEAVQQEFATRVAFMAVYPYMRTSVQTMAMRLGVPAPVLGIVRQGGMSVTGTMDDEQIRQAFEDRTSELPEAAPGNK